MEVRREELEGTRGGVVLAAGRSLGTWIVSVNASSSTASLRSRLSQCLSAPKLSRARQQAVLNFSATQNGRRVRYLECDSAGLSHASNRISPLGALSEAHRAKPSTFPP